MNLTNKIAIVTGASKGLGASFSRLLCEKETTVYGIARSAQDLADLQAKLGNRFIPVVMDVTQRKAVEEWISQTFSDTHIPDILINNAGIGFHGKVDETPVETWDTLLAVNVTAIFDFTRLILPFMKKTADTSYIFNICSIAGLLGNPELVAYNASKFAVRGFSEALMKEVRRDHIKVTTMFPGSIETAFLKQANMQSASYRLDPDEIAKLAVFLLETSPNFLVDELTLRPLIPN